MILNDEQRERYYMMLDSLTIYANDRLGISDRLLSGDPEMINPFEQAQVAKEIWTNNKGIIDEFLDDPMCPLSREDARQVELWKNVIVGKFTAVAQPGGDMIFVGEDGYAFVVSGISREMTAILPRTPTVVDSALIPFDDRIVYGGYVFEVAYDAPAPDVVQLSASMLTLFSQGKVLASPEQFLEISQKISDARMQREIDDMMRDLDTFGEGKANAGTYRGALADLDGEARNQAIYEQVDNGTGFKDATFGDLLSKWICPGQVRTKLADCLEFMTKAELIRYSHFIPELNLSMSMKKAELIEKIAVALAEDADMFVALSCGSSLEQVRALRKLAFEGRIEKRMNALLNFKDLPTPIAPYVYVFQEDDKAVFIMPEEICALSRKVDWNDAIEFAKFYGRALNVANALVELRGLVTLREAYEELMFLRPDTVGTFEEFVGLLQDAALTESQKFDLLNTGEERYLIHFDFSSDYTEALDREGAYRGEVGERAFLHGPLSPVMSEVLQKRTNVPVRHLEPSMATEESAVQAILETLPPVVAMTKFLDANVPEGENEYFYADRVVEQLVNMSHGGYNPEDYFEYLRQTGFTPDQYHFTDTVDKLKNLVEAIPRWDNNGWSEVEIRQFTTGETTFYNEDGAPMKVGANDPCPCGSGKQYKDCHGQGTSFTGSFTGGPADSPMF